MHWRLYKSTLKILTGQGVLPAEGTSKAKKHPLAKAPFRQAGKFYTIKDRVVADVWEKDVWDFQAKSGSSRSCRLFLGFFYFQKIAVQEMSGKAPGSPRHPSSRHPRLSEKKEFVLVTASLWFIVILLSLCLILCHSYLVVHIFMLGRGAKLLSLKCFALACTSPWWAVPTMHRPRGCLRMKRVCVVSVLT